jgi:hypothetical protein
MSFYCNNLFTLLPEKSTSPYFSEEVPQDDLGIEAAKKS